MPLDDILNSVVPDEGIVAETTASDDAPASGQQAAETGEQVGEPEAEREEGFRWDKVPEELVPHVKHFQADYTRKSQELAEQRKQLEQQAQQYQSFAALEQLAQQDPALARQILASRLGLTDEVVQAATSETDPYAQIELSETEQFLVEQQRKLMAQQEQFQQFYEQQMRQQARSQVEAEFAELSRTVGREIPASEQEQIAAFCVANQIPNVALGFKAWDYDQALNRARQAGVDRGAAVVQQKAGMAPAPVTAADRAGTVAEGPRSLEDVVAAAVAAAGL